MNRHPARDYKRPRRGSGEGIRPRDFAMGLMLGLAVAAIVFVLDHRAGTGGSDLRRPPAHATVDTAGADSGTAHGPGRRSAAHGKGGRKQSDSSEPGSAADPPDGGSAAGNAPDRPDSSAARASGPGQSDGARAAGSASVTAIAKPANAGDTGSAAAVGKFDFYQMLPRFQVVIPEREHGIRPPPSAQIDRPGTYFLQVGSYRDRSVAERVRADVVRLGVSATVQRIAIDNDVWQRVRVGPIHDLTLLNRLRRQLQAGNLDALVIRVED